MSIYTYKLNENAGAAIKAVKHSNNRGILEDGLWVDYEVSGDTLIVRRISSGILIPVTITSFTSFERLCAGDQGVAAIVAKSLGLSKIKVGPDRVHLVDSIAESEKILKKARINSAAKTLGFVAGVAAVVGITSWLSNRN